MSEVSNKVISDVIRFLESQGHDRTQLLASVSVKSSDLKYLQTSHIFNASETVPWRVYVALLSALEKNFKSDDFYREFMNWSVTTKAEWIGSFSPVAKFFVSPKLAYNIVGWVMKMFFSNIDTKLKFHSDSIATLEISIRPEYEPCKPFFKFVAAGMEALPTILGFPPSNVILASEDMRAEVKITLPKTTTISFFRQIVQLVRNVFGIGALVSLLKDRESEIQNIHKQLVEGKIDLELDILNRASELQEINQQLTLLMQNSPDNIVLIGRDKKIAYINKIAENYRREDVIGASCLDFIPAAFRGTYSEILDNAFVRGEYGSIEIPITDNTFFMTRVVPVGGKDNCKQVLLISTDVTKLKLADQRLSEARDLAFQAIKTKSSFLANISHEIRTPLTAMLGYADLLAELNPIDPRKHKEYCDRITTSGKHLQSLVNDILDIAKIESGTLKDIREKFSPAEVIQEVFDLFAIQASGKNLKLTNAPTIPLDIVLVGDPGRLRQILVNLVSNAIKFTSSGSIEIVGMVNPIDMKPGRTQISISVTDTGCGIDLENSAYLFAPFEQADNSSTRKFGGTGLGLFLSKQFAKLLGGDLVLLTSRLSFGSTFLVTAEFDLVNSNSKSETIQSDKKSVQVCSSVSSSLEKKTILIVEDNKDLALLISIQLEAAGYKTLMSYDGKAAISATVETKPDLILMDLQLPIMDGYGSTKELRKLNISTPIIALTANAREEDRHRCIDSGFTDYWSKPLPRDELLQGIASAIALSETVNGSAKSKL